MNIQQLIDSLIILKEKHGNLQITIAENSSGFGYSVCDLDNIIEVTSLDAFSTTENGVDGNLIKEYR